MNCNCILSTNKIEDGIKKDNIYYKGDSFFDIKKDLLYFKGFIFPEDYTVNDLHDIILKKGFYSLKKLKGEFTIIYYNSNKNEILIINDRVGRYELFTYFKNGSLYVADDFWEMIKYIKPTIDDIDPESVRELVFTFYPLFNRTIIKGLNYLPSATVIEYDINEKVMKKEQYWDFKYVSEKRDEEMAVNGLYNNINNCFKFLKKHYDRDTVFGCGLSGGLDSRMIPHFAKKNGMKLVSFKLGKFKNKRGIITHDNKVAIDIAKKYGIKHTAVDYDKENIEEKVFNVVKSHPHGYHNITYSTIKGVPEFDVLIGASGPLSISRGDFTDKDLTDEELVDKLITDATLIGKNYLHNKKISKLKKLINLIFREPIGLGHTRKLIEPWPGLLTYDQLENIKKKILRFVSTNRPQNDVSIYEKYLLHLSSKNLKAPFEGLMGTRKGAHSIYYPFAFDYIRTLEPKWFIDREILRRVISEKMPEIANIPEEASPHLVIKKDSFFYKLKLKFRDIIFYFRGYGFPGAGWDNNTEYNSYIESIFNRPNTIFNEMFDSNMVKSSKSINLNLYLQLAKTKILLDTIVYKEWDKYIV